MRLPVVRVAAVAATFPAAAVAATRRRAEAPAVFRMLHTPLQSAIPRPCKQSRTVHRLMDTNRQ